MAPKKTQPRNVILPPEPPSHKSYLGLIGFLILLAAIAAAFSYFSGKINPRRGTAAKEEISLPRVNPVFSGTISQIKGTSIFVDRTEAPKTKKKTLFPLVTRKRVIVDETTLFIEIAPGVDIFNAASKGIKKDASSLKEGVFVFVYDKVLSFGSAVATPTQESFAEAIENAKIETIPAKSIIIVTQ